jgi:hypothetical protein
LIAVLPRLLRVLGLIVVTLIVGNIAPALAIGNNIESFSGEQRSQAITAWREARSFIGGSLEPLFVRAVRVEAIVDDTPLARTRCRSTRPPVSHATQVRVQYYTAFGVPWSVVHVILCDGEPASVIR